MPPLLTVLIPAFDEAGTIVRVLDAVAAAPYEKQIVVVDDASRDETALLVERWRAGRSGVELVRHPENRGKGAAIRTGLARARGRLVIVQDADLEYDPQDFPRLVQPALDGRARVVYGSRYLAPAERLPWTPNRVCVGLLNLLVRVLYGQRITDEATCYKLFETELLRSLDLRCERFEFCPEVTAKVCRSGIPILEVPISYAPRTAAEGKKIGWRDGVEAIRTLLAWRSAPFEPAAPPSSRRAA